MTMFLDELRAGFDDRSTVGLAIEHDLEPLEGAHAPVAPPTYKGTSGGSEFPVSQEAPIPEPNAGGWLSGVRRDETGAAVTDPSVVLDSVASQAGRAESALWQHRSELGGLPAFVVSAPDDANEHVAGMSLSSWQASHRHVDAWFKYAAEHPGEAPLWKDPNGDGRMKSLLTRINSTSDAREAFAYAPNSLLYGWWLSSGVARLHRQARVYRSEIVGYGARAHHGGATKWDPIPSGKATELSRADFGAPVKQKGAPVKQKQEDQARPSELGFGLVPGNVTVQGFTCERIAARATVSLSGLRGMRYGSEASEPQRRRAASVALLTLALAGDLLGRQDTLLRSGCDLMPVASRVGWRVAGRSAPVELKLPERAHEPEWWGEQLQAALEDCREYGLVFADPVHLALSSPQKKMVSDAMARQESDENSETA